ncbi:MAG: hypothetical protein LC776_06280, partial [Acidobacteria bacterium]|nr:hypothetical protein [Acidobacteriota bacterium]
MSLDTWDDPEQLFLVRGADVSASRPLFTGDILDGVPIPGVQDDGTAMVVAHPCSMRGRAAQLLDRITVVAVRPHDYVPPHKWRDGFYDRMPLPEVRGLGAAFAAAHLD